MEDNTISCEVTHRREAPCFTRARYGSCSSCSDATYTYVCFGV